MKNLQRPILSIARITNFYLFIIILIKPFCSFSQILHTESFTVILDSTQSIKGSIIPDFKFKNLKEDLIEFESIADFSAKFGQSAITFANKIELSKFGNETLVSGGYVYGEIRKIVERKFALEFYGQVHWAEARGMERKYAGGLNFRWRILNNYDIGVYAGAGAFYEYERWNFDGVSNSDLIPLDDDPREIRNVKLGSYISFKYSPVDQLFIDLSVYYQSRFDQLATVPRLASSSRLTYNFTEYLGVSIIYQNIYDPRPIVPIDKLFNSVTTGITISF